MKNLKLIFLFLIFLIISSSCTLRQKTLSPIVEVTATTTPKRELPTIIPSKTMIPSTATPTLTATPTITPTATPLVVDYKIMGKIDLGNGLPVAMLIYTTDGRIVKSNWASAIAYKDGDDPNVFNPYAGTIYSHNDGGFLASWVHSGYLKNGNQLYGYPLEKEVWLGHNNQVVDWKSGMEKATALIGAKVILCQAPVDSKIKPFDTYDDTVPCPGLQMEFVVSASSLVERAKVDAYESSIGSVVEWMKLNYPDQGFGNLKPRSSYLIQTCVGPYSDQISDGTVEFIYNRLILGFTIRE